MYSLLSSSTFQARIITPGAAQAQNQARFVITNSPSGTGTLKVIKQLPMTGAVGATTAIPSTTIITSGTPGKATTTTTVRPPGVQQIQMSPIRPAAGVAGTMGVRAPVPPSTTGAATTSQVTGEYQPSFDSSMLMDYCVNSVHIPHGYK